MRRNIVVCSVPFVALFLGLAAASAQDRPVTTLPDRGDTLKVTVSGEIDFEGIYRGPEITAYTESYSNPAPFPLGAPDTSDGETTFEGHTAVRFGVELSERVSAVVEVGTRRIDTGEINEFGGEESPDVVLREAHVLIEGFLADPLSIQLGLSTWSFDVRGRGSPLVFAPRQSQTMGRNLDSLGSPASEEYGSSRLVEAGYPDVLDPMGAWIRYGGDSFVLDIVALPAVIENGPPSQDEALYAVDAFVNLDDRGSRLGGIVAVSAMELFSVPPAGKSLMENTSVFTVGGGGTLIGLLVDGLELYGELYFQFGDAGQQDVGGVEDDLKAGGFAAQAGIEYHHTVGNPLPLWVGANVTHYSGDGDEAADNDDTVDRFMSYEGINDLMILESMEYGFDVDSNYTVFKFMGGCTLSAAREQDLALKAILGLARMSEDVIVDPVAGEKEDDLGTELDIRARWSVSRQVVLKAAVAFLFGSEILEESMGGSANDNAEDSTFLATLGMDVKF